MIDERSRSEKEVSLIITAFNDHWSAEQFDIHATRLESIFHSYFADGMKQALSMVENHSCNNTCNPLGVVYQCNIVISSEIKQRISV